MRSPCLFVSTLVLSLVLMARPASAAEASRRDALLISATELARVITQPDLVLLHVGTEEGYLKGHLPGARFVRLRDLVTAEGFNVLPADDLRSRLAALGISDTSRIVVYAADDWLSPATRVVFTLDYAGLGTRTRWLDGGVKAWTDAGQQLVKEPPPQKEGSLSALRLQPLVVDAAYVRSHLAAPGVVIVDARNSEFHTGAKAGGRPDQPQRSGHIAGAVSLPFGSGFDDALRLLPEPQLREVFAKAGVKPGDTVVAYCHIGQQATAVIFAARALGYEARLYDGSFEEWSALTEYPVETSPAAIPR